jgi:hypothetical protein
LPHTFRTFISNFIPLNFLSAQRLEIIIIIIIIITTVIIIIIIILKITNQRTAVRKE